MFRLIHYYCYFDCLYKLNLYQELLVYLNFDLGSSYKSLQKELDIFQEIFYNFHFRFEDEDNFGLNVITMPNALLGSEELYLHPELRAKDLMDAFKDKEIKAIFCNLGGDDTVRLLPFF